MVEGKRIHRITRIPGPVACAACLGGPPTDNYYWEFVSSETYYCDKCEGTRRCPVPFSEVRNG